MILSWACKKTEASDQGKAKDVTECFMGKQSTKDERTKGINDKKTQIVIKSLL